MWIEETVRDVRLAGRRLVREPSFTTVVVLTLALGIGANTAMFSVIQAVLLTPLPFRDPERVVWIAENSVSNGNTLTMVFGGDFQEWRSRARSFDGLSVLLAGDATVSGEEPFQVRVVCVSESLSRIFGVAPVFGRDFLSEELVQAPQAPGLRVPGGTRAAVGAAIVSDRLFRRLGGAADILGKPLVIGTTSYKVIGVLAPGFRLPVAPSLQLGIGPRSDVDVVLNTTVASGYRGPGAVVGRLKPGIPIESARAELEAIRAAANQSRDLNTSSRVDLQVSSLHDHVVGGTRRVLLVLWGAVAFVLLVACVNIVSLLLARAVAHQQEAAIRTALGAGRWRLVRQMLAHSLVLACVGGLAGIALAYGIVRILMQPSAIDVPRLQDAALDWKVLLFSAAACAMCGVGVGIVPSIASSANLGETLKESARTALGSSRVRRWHGVLVVCELALALIPLAGAGLMVKSLWRVRAEGAVLSPGQVLTARVQGGTLQGSAVPAARLRASDRLLAQVESLPGVRAAALWSVTFGYPARIAGLPRPEDETMAMWFNVSPRYREAAGVPLLAGRWFADRDRTASPPVVVVSERFARTFTRDLPSLDAIVGRTTFGPFVPSGSPDRDGPMTVIGVVSDTRSGRLGILQPDDAKALPQVFFPDVLRPMAGGELLVRTASDPLAFVGPIRRIVGASGAKLIEARTLDDQLSAAVAPRTFNTGLMVAFGGIALLLAVVGTYGVLSYAVSQRTREIGVRIALGAQRVDILRMLLTRAAALVMAGVAIGLLGCAGLARVIGSLLYNVKPTDAWAYAAVCLVIVVVALLASYIPARRAMRVDPIVALRHE
jgi:putative ABC transport system permease protein